MRLSDLLSRAGIAGPQGSSRLDQKIASITRDSRRVDESAVFVAIRGASVDGHDLVGGLGPCAAVVAERPVPTDAPLVLVEDTRHALAALAAALHGAPSESMRVVGLTGTNGKTTTAEQIDAMLRHDGVGWRCGRIGTLGASIDGVPHPSSLTTPEAPALQALLAHMRDGGLQAVAMEVSSIGLHQRRVDSTRFHVGVFTGLTRDHLGFHGTMEAYARAKARLFTDLLRPAGGLPRALLCGDDPSWTRMQPPADRWLYGVGPGCDARLEGLACGPRGLQFELHTPVGSAQVRSPLLGRHNALNVAAAVTAGVLLGAELQACAAAVAEGPIVRGRLETVPNDRGVLVAVDYAHTPDALAAALGAVRDLVPGRSILVFGCGGDRDAGKRPQMGEVARRLADVVVVTSDNPRSEDPLQIIADILQGTSESVHSVVDREEAIALALELAEEGDAVLIAGKGHETTQAFRDRTVPFDDRAVARGILEGR